MNLWTSSGTKLENTVGYLLAQVIHAWLNVPYFWLLNELSCAVLVCMECIFWDTYWAQCPKTIEYRWFMNFPVLSLVSFKAIVNPSAVWNLMSWFRYGSSLSGILNCVQHEEFLCPPGGGWQQELFLLYIVSFPMVRSNLQREPRRQKIYHMP